MEWLNAFSQRPEVEVGDRIVPIAIRRHPRAKRLTMRVAPDGSEIRVTLPRWGQSREATAFAKSRLGWLEKQLALSAPAQEPRNGSTIPIMGRNFRIHWDRNFARKPELVDACIRAGGPEDGLAARLERWLRAQALETMTRDLAHYCDRAALDAPRLGLSRAQRRWGSCSTSGTVRVNWRLIMAPDHVRRSVVAHEVAHLVHFDHSPAFHNLLGELYDGDIRIPDRWLKTKGRTLYSHFG